MALFDTRPRFLDVSLLLLRIGIGVSFVFVYGPRKLFGGPEEWATLGQNMSVFGITFWPEFWGFMGAFAEFGGGILLMLGLLLRPALFLLLCTMVVAASGHIFGDIGGGPWHATEMATVFVVLWLLGPGKYSLDAVFFGSKRPAADEAEPQFS